MKKILFTLIALMGLTFAFSSCSNDSYIGETYSYTFKPSDSKIKEMKHSITFIDDETLIMTNDNKIVDENIARIKEEHKLRYKYSSKDKVFKILEVISTSYNTYTNTGSAISRTAPNDYSTCRFRFEENHTKLIWLERSDIKYGSTFTLE